MQLRPYGAYWFEVVVPYGDVEDAMEALARHAEVQFEWHGDHGARNQIDALQGPLALYRILSNQYARFWPPLVLRNRCCDPSIELALEAALARIHHWVSAAKPKLDQYDHLLEERAALGIWPSILNAFVETRIDLGRLAEAGPVFSGACVVLPPRSQRLNLANGLEAQVSLGDGRAILVLVPSEDLEPLRSRVSALGGQCLGIMDWFEGDVSSCAELLRARRVRVDRRMDTLEAQLRALALENGVDQAAAVLERIDWFQQHARDIQCDDGVCWITGWTSEPNRALLEGALREIDVQSPVMFRDPPDSAITPSVSANPTWLRPFEIFTRAIGVPGLQEADPTTWVALLVPLLFGYMCGDVGHGVVIILAGLLLRNRTTLWPLLVFCGIAATGFGFVFGDVFGLEHLIEPLWIRPMDEPLLILLVPVVAGTLVLTLGVVLHAVQTCWRGEGGSRGVADAAQLLVYWGLLLLILDPRWGWLAVAGAMLCVANRLRGRPTPANFVEGVGHLAQGTFEMLMNTLSFARVGAFALAHAALESTVVILAEDAALPGLTFLVLALGNLLIIVLEGVVVSVQTTRLVLFEFFARFFTGEGRQLQPTLAPRLRSRTRTSEPGSHD